MVSRLQKLSQSNSLFLFGARGSGKSTLLKDTYRGKSVLWIDLLTAADEDLYQSSPDQLSYIIKNQKPKKVIIDEIQKIPKLLDVVHKEIEADSSIQFILTGSSARKLKQQGANLLAGRAFEQHLFPLTTFELAQQFDLNEALRFGSLPRLLHLNSHSDKAEFLRTYARTYLKEEILQEQIIRNVEPFRNFLEIAAQANAKILSYAKISRDVNVDDKTVKNYFSILIDTFLGFYLMPFHRSIRKRQNASPKFYFFDLGVKNALLKTLRLEVPPQSYAFGEAFETWVVQECFRLNEYKKLDFTFSYLRTEAGVEIDLIVERPGEQDLLVEIKSAKTIRAEDVASISGIAKDWDRDVQAQVWSLDEKAKTIGKIECLHWTIGLKRLLS